MYDGDSDTVSLTREQLYKKVWKKSAVQLAKEFGVSDVAVAKACKRHQIPKPPLGYWARIQHGQKVQRPRLPKLDNPRLQTIRFTSDPNAQRNRDMSPETEKIMQQETSKESKIVVKSALESPHAVVARTEKSLRSASPDQHGILRPKADGCLHVAVSTESIERVMCIMDALIKAVEGRGMKMKPRDGNDKIAAIEVEGNFVDIELTELLAERPRELTPEQKLENEKHPVVKPHSLTEQYPCGQLVLSFVGATRYSRHRCSERTGAPLEDRLNEVMAWLHKEAGTLRTIREEREAEERYWAEQRRIREEEERLRREETARIKKLEEDMAAWRKFANGFIYYKQQAEFLQFQIDAAKQTAAAQTTPSDRPAG